MGLACRIAQLSKVGRVQRVGERGVGTCSGKDDTFAAREEIRTTMTMTDGTE